MSKRLPSQPCTIKCLLEAKKARHRGCLEPFWPLLMSLIRSSSLTFSLLKPAERLLSAPMPRSHELVCCCSRFTTDLVSPLLGYVSEQYKIFWGNNAQDKQQVFCHQHLMCSVRESWRHNFMRPYNYLLHLFFAHIQ